LHFIGFHLALSAECWVEGLLGRNCKRFGVRSSRFAPQATPEPSHDARSLAIADSKGSADAKQAAESAQRRIDIAAEATLRLAEARRLALGPLNLNAQYMPLGVSAWVRLQIPAGYCAHDSSKTRSKLLIKLMAFQLQYLPFIARNA
jgi:hypothetical protein